jgi:hypothetical protein
MWLRWEEMRKSILMRGVWFDVSSMYRPSVLFMKMYVFDSIAWCKHDRYHHKFKEISLQGKHVIHHLPLSLSLSLLGCTLARI